MPKGYGYDKPPKKASGFKMRGFSYPGQSPIKGKKKAEETAAQQQRADAMEGLQDLEIKGESTNLLQGTNTLYGNVDSPFNKRTLVQDIHRAPINKLIVSVGEHKIILIRIYRLCHLKLK